MTKEANVATTTLNPPFGVDQARRLMLGVDAPDPKELEKCLELIADQAGSGKTSTVYNIRNGLPSLRNELRRRGLRVTRGYDTQGDSRLNISWSRFALLLNRFGL